MSEKLPNIHPGEILLEEFPKPMGITPYRLSLVTGIPQPRLSQIIHRQRRITADTALRLARFFSVSPKFWLGLQMDFDLEEREAAIREQLQTIHPQAV